MHGLWHLNPTNADHIQLLFKMKKLAIFHHVYQSGDWEKIYTDQVVKLQNSGLFDAADYLFLGVNGNKELPFTLQKTNKTLFNLNNDPPTEFITIKALYDYCSLHKDANVLFIHTKGVNWTSTEKNKNNMIKTRDGEFTTEHIYNSTQSWRKYLEYFVIHKWRKCVELLETHDIVGTEWVQESDIENICYKIPHYSGGMWWANSNFIKTLDANFIIDNMIIGRYATELWIGTKDPKYYNFHTVNRNLYLYPVTESEYETLA